MPRTPLAGRVTRTALLTIPALVLVACGGGSGHPSAEAPSPSHSSLAPTHVTGHVIRLTKYGVSFAVPASWTSLDAAQVGDPHNPVIRTIAHRLGVTPQQVVASFRASLQSVSVTDQGAVRGVLDNINSVGSQTASLTDDDLKLQFASLGAKPGAFHHFHSPAGPATRVAYRWSTNGYHFHGEIVAIDVGDAVVSITVTAHSAPAARALADHVQASIARLD
jgi:hypothetical protein